MKILPKIISIFVILFSFLIILYQPPVFAASCTINPNTIPDDNRTHTVTLTATGLASNTRYEFRYRDQNREQHGRLGRSDGNGRLTNDFDISRNVNSGPLIITIQPVSGSGSSCTVTVTVGSGTTPQQPPPGGQPPGGGQQPPSATGGGALPSGGCPTDQVSTALGCIATGPGAFVTQVLSIAIGIAGGIAFILMVIGAIRMLVSGGDPEALAAGRDMLTSAIAGLLFIIFSVVILRIIGLDILHIPGFVGGP